MLSAKEGEVKKLRRWILSTNLQDALALLGSSMSNFESRFVFLQRDIEAAREAFEKSVRGAPGCGGRIVEFVSETGGEFAKSGEFVALLLAAGDFADAVGEKSDEALAQRGHALKHFLEEGGGKEKKMDGLFRAAGDGEMRHA